MSAAHRFAVPRRRMSPARRDHLRSVLDALYERYTHAPRIGMDPIAFPRRFEVLADREIVALLAASLAYGRVAQISRNMEALLHRLGPEPSRFVMESPPTALRRALSTFRHRWTDGEAVVGLLLGVRRLREAEGSLEAALSRRLAVREKALLPALADWVQALRINGRPSRLLADPAGGSACKRLHLFLRWMVREDAVDPGGWRSISPRLLMVPVDVHMHRVGRGLRFTRSRQAGLRAVLEITAGFRAVNETDPVRYDFALTRFGIVGSTDVAKLLSGAGGDAQRLLDVALAN